MPLVLSAAKIGRKRIVAGLSYGLRKFGPGAGGMVWTERYPEREKAGL
jgi:hypothetical protein